MVVAQIDSFGGAGEAIASCQPPEGRAYTYIVARDNYQRNAINKLHGHFPVSVRQPGASRRLRGGNTIRKETASKFEHVQI